MKSYFFAFIALFLLTSCKKESYQSNQIVLGSKNVNYREDDSFLYLNSDKFHYKIPLKQLPFKKIMLLNASLVGYFTELGAEDLIVGISSPEYVYSERIHQLIASHKIIDVGNEQKYNIEKILAYHPDAIFTNHIASFENTYEILKKNGIEVVFIDDYKEEDPLGKSKIIEVFGKLIGKEKIAQQKFSEIEQNYLHLKSIASKVTKRPQVLVNEIYGNQWYVAGGNSILAHFIKDAGADYIFGDNKESSSTPKSFEEVYKKAESAEFWVNVGNHQSKKELLVNHPQYGKMKVYQKGNIYTLSGKEKGRSNDFFECGTVRADLVLKDYVKIFHPQLFPKDSLFYMKKLK